jgi:acetoacetyl-CoA synthetase
MSQANILWTPSQDFIEGSHLKAFMNWLKKSRSKNFRNYQELHDWSVTYVAEFWQCVYDYFEVSDHGNPEFVCKGEMPSVSWFGGSKLNYAEHLLRYKEGEEPAIIHASEIHETAYISWSELRKKVASFQQFLIKSGVSKGDRVAAYMTNTPEATIAFIATVGLGAIWSSCSPDFGISSVVDRFEQIEPTVLIAANGYTYNGKKYLRMEEVRNLQKALPTLKKTVVVEFLPNQGPIENTTSWQDSVSFEAYDPIFVHVDFMHPIWVLYSSGTTGKPKAITHCHGGILLEHLKYMAFHNDVHPGEKFFWYSTTGWMMWNFTQAALLMGASIVLYEGSPAFPNMSSLWILAEKEGIHHFGTSAPFLIACMKKDLDVKSMYSLTKLRSIGSTGAPLPPEAFEYVYAHVKSNVWLCSMAGGTDVCTAFVGGTPLESVYAGEIQCRALACDLVAYSEEGKAVVNELGEMVIRKPMPSMPVYFWNDHDNERYISSYFDVFPGMWRHGDWIKINEKGALVIYGRSDATLNRQGVRIGTAEIYSSVNKIEEITDSLVVNIEKEDGSHYMPLFIVLAEGLSLNDKIRNRLSKQLKTDYSPRHVPDEVIPVNEIPYTISGKKMEAPVKKILMGMSPDQSLSKDAMKNPGAMDFFIDFYKRQLLNK